MSPRSGPQRKIDAMPNPQRLHTSYSLVNSHLTRFMIKP